MNIPAPFTVKQHEYLVRCLDSWLNVAEGGKRGGKNVLQTMAFCIGLDDHPNRLHLVAGVSGATAGLNILDCDGYGLYNYFEGRWRKGSFQNRECVYIQSRTGEKIVLVSGGGKLGDEKLIKGNTYGTAYVTEANECAQPFLQEVFDRTLSSKDRKVYHDLNPKPEGHWYYSDILQFHERQQALDPEYGYNYGHFTIADNMSISDEGVRQALKTYDKNSLWYQRDILGKRKQAEGLVYPQYERAVVPTEPRRYTEYQIVGDYGIHNPTAFGLFGKCEGVWYLVKEYYHSGRDSRDPKTDEEYYKELVKFAGDLPIRRVILDPSAASFITLVKKCGQFSVRAADNAVIDGIRATGMALSHGMLKINDCCTNTIREFGLYSWDDKKAEDKPVKENDHCMDFTRYFVQYNRREILHGVAA